MRFSAIGILLILSWAGSTITRQIENSPDTSTKNPPDSIDLGDLPVIKPGNPEKSVESSDRFLAKTNDLPGISPDTIGSLDSSDVKSVNVNEPKHFPNPMLMADDAPPPIELNVPPCQFGNPIVPGNLPEIGGPPWKLMDPSNPSRASK